MRLPGIALNASFVEAKHLNEDITSRGQTKRAKTYSLAARADSLMTWLSAFRAFGVNRLPIVPILHMPGEGAAGEIVGKCECLRHNGPCAR